MAKDKSIKLEKKFNKKVTKLEKIRIKLAEARRHEDANSSLGHSTPS